MTSFLDEQVATKHITIPKPENAGDNYYGFVERSQDYYKKSTDARIQYGRAISIQLLGHTLGWETVNLIQPKAVHHNCNVVLIGESTISRKSTVQELGQDVFPEERMMLSEPTPERFVGELAKDPQRVQFLGEFTGLIKGINSGSYMSRLAELYNDFHGCPKIYTRGLAEHKGKESTFVLNKVYLSVNSTITPAMMKQYLTEELAVGGFLPRWLVVYGDALPKPRKRLAPDILKLGESLRYDLQRLYGYKRDLSFVLDDGALTRFNEIEAESYKKYEKVMAFVGRYQNYVISFADIIATSDAVGKMIETEAIDFVSTLSGLLKLNDKISIDGMNQAWVPKEYIDRAWAIIEPCLEYATTLIDYVMLDKPVAKLMEYLKKVKYANHSDAMQHTHLSAKQMHEAVQTLVERKDIKIENEDIEREGAGSITKSNYRWVRRE